MPRIDARSICLIRLSAIGDTIHALALANGLRRGYPDARITWILEPLPYEIVREQTAIDRFIVFNARGGIAQWRHLRTELKKERFDLAVVPQVSSKAALVAALAPARVKLGFDRNRSRELHSLVINQRIPAGSVRHAQDQFLEFLEALGVDPTPEWNLQFTPEEDDQAQSFFGSLGRPAAALVIASSHPEKDWTVEGYARIADHLDGRGIQPLLVGGPSAREAAFASSIEAACHSKPIRALDRPIRTTMLRLRGSAIVVSPDTGPLHMAVAMNRPTIGLYGYSDPRRCGPYRRFSELLVDHYHETGEPLESVSRRTKPGRTARITAEEVIEKIDLGLRLYPASGLS